MNNFSMIWVVIAGLHLAGCVSESPKNVANIAKPTQAAPTQKGVDAYNSGNYLIAAGELRPLADQKNATAQYYLGVMYDKGNGVVKDYEKALELFRNSAGQGNVPAQFQVGVMYRKGRGVLRDEQEAMIWFRKAAVQGHMNAQHNLGRLYEFNVRDYSNAVHWYLLAAEQGHRGSQQKLVRLYSQGRPGVPKDLDKALKWARNFKYSRLLMHVYLLRGEFEEYQSISDFRAKMRARSRNNRN